MAIINVSEELIKECPEAFEAIKKHYKVFKELIPRLVATRTFEVQGEGLPEDETVIIPTIKLVNGEYVFEKEI